MNKTEFLEKLKIAAEIQTEEKKIQQERFKALIEKIKSGSELNGNH